MSNRVHKSTGWQLFLRTVAARAYPRITYALREKSGLIFDVILPLIGLSAYVFVYRAIGAPPAFIGFVILGGAMSAFWINVLWTMSNQFFWERETGTLALYIMAPTSLMAILLGMALGGMVVATIRAATILIVGSWLFGVDYAISSASLLAAIFVLTLTALYGMGMMFASVFLFFGRAAWHVVSLSQEPVHLLAGMYFPVKTLGTWLASAASLIPLTLGLDAMRQILFPAGATLGFLTVGVEASALVVLTIVFLIAARAALWQMERLAAAEGTLTESRG